MSGTYSGPNNGLPGLDNPTGDGGNGGAGLLLTGDNTIDATGVVLGGPGGSGGSLDTSHLYRGNGGAGGDGIDQFQSDAGALTNAGTIGGGAGGYGLAGTGGAGGVGFYSKFGGTLDNLGVIGGGGAGGYRGAGGDAIYFGFAGTLTNAGTISGGASGLAGMAGAGIDLQSGAVTNDAKGEIDGGGSSGGSHSFGGYGVKLRFDGTVTNHGTIRGGPAGDSAIYGNGGAGVFLGSTGTLINDGTISGGVGNIGGVGGDGADLMGPGTLINTGTGTISGASDVDGTGGLGVDLASGGVATNGGIIRGGSGVGGGNAVNSTSGALTNEGTIKGGIGTYLSANGVYMMNGGALTNRGEIDGGDAGAGPGSSGRGGTAGDGVKVAPLGLGAATLTNYGTIRGGAGYSSKNFADDHGGNAVAFESPGTLINQGTISGGNSQFIGGDGVYVNGSGSTLTNAGTISGGSGGTDFGSGDAVDFGGGGSRLIFDPGAVFIGQVVATGTDNTLELAPGTIAGAVGTIGGIGTQFTGFDRVQVDSGANWHVTTLTSLDSDTGIFVLGNATLTNAGTISGGSGTYSGGDGVNVAAGGFLFNNGTITGGTGGSGGPFGADPGGNGVVLTGGVSLANLGLIHGGDGANGNAGNGDTGGIGGAGIDVVDGGSFTAGGVITGGNGGTGGAFSGAGGVGVQFVDGGTLLASGTISGGNGRVDGFAVYFGAGDSRLTIDPGAVFNGNVAAVGTGNTLELSKYAGHPALGVISGIGTQFIGFDQLEVSPFAAWDVAGTTTLGPVTNSGAIEEQSADTLTINGSVTGRGVIQLDPSTVTLNGYVSSGQTIEFRGPGGNLKLGDPIQFGGTISGFTIGDGIDLTAVPRGSITGDSFNHSTGVLTLYDSSGNLNFQFANPGSYSGDFFHLAAYGSGGTAIAESTTPCFCRGGLILTPCGEVAVEDLAIGDWVVTHSGQAEPIKWIGRRSYAGRFLAGQRHSLPIRIRASALADDVPKRDLWVSPQHAIHLDGYLIPTGELVNGISITQESVDRVDYFHLELDSHALIYAEGATTETFVDDNSRMLFENADEYERLYPNEARVRALFCAERLSEGYEVEMIRWRVADRAEALWPSRTSRAA